MCRAREDAAYQRQNLGMQYGAKQQAVERTARQHDAAYGGNVGGVEGRPCGCRGVRAANLRLWSARPSR